MDPARVYLKWMIEDLGSFTGDLIYRRLPVSSRRSHSDLVELGHIDDDDQKLVRYGNLKLAVNNIGTQIAAHYCMNILAKTRAYDATKEQFAEYSYYYTLRYMQKLERLDELLK